MSSFNSPSKKLFPTSLNFGERVQATIVEIDDEFEQLQQCPHIRPPEKHKIAKLQDIFFRLFHQQQQQLGNIDNIREFASHKPGDKTPLNSSRCS
jgi:hypothetical protein